MGSTINLTCVVSNTARPPLRVEWEKDGQVLSYLGPRYNLLVVFSVYNYFVTKMVIGQPLQYAGLEFRW